MENRMPASTAPYSVSQSRFSVSDSMVTTAFDIPGYRIKQNLGVVREILVWSQNLFVNIGAGLQTLVGGNITPWSKLCEETCKGAFDIMIQHATEIGANAIIGGRYDASEMGGGATEVLASGTAVIVEPTEDNPTYK